MSDKLIREQYKRLAGDLGRKGINANAVKAALKRFTVEIPSWGFGAFGGGRFGAYMPPGPARNVFEKIDDACEVARITGAVGAVALHTGWDKPEHVAFDRITVEDFKQLAAYCKTKHIAIGAVNPTLFLKGTHLGSLSSADSGVRRMLIDHCVVSARIAARYGSGLVTYWLPDGSSYPGQKDIAAAEMRTQSALVEVARTSPAACRHLIEYKLFEPGTYSTVIQDAGIAKDLAAALGKKGGVLVDMGHHAWAVNIAQIVARLIARGVPGGFHFNTRYAADDDHAVEPGLRIFEVFVELVAGKVAANPVEAKNWAYMIDQCSAIENRIHAVLHSIDSLQVSLAKALIVDRPRLKAMQDTNDIIRANRVLLDAFLTDVRPLVAMARIENGGTADPVEAYVKSGYQQRIEKARGGR